MYMTNTQCISLFYPLRAFVMAKGHLSGPPLSIVFIHSHRGMRCQIKGVAKTTRTHRNVPVFGESAVITAVEIE